MDNYLQFFSGIGCWLLLAYEIVWKKVLEKWVENVINKHHIKSSTSLQESVKSDYQKNLQLFSKDLAFKYDFFLEQYKEIYAPLYKLICESESERYIVNSYLDDKNEFIHFSDVPVVFPEGKIQEKINDVINLVESHPYLSEPQLLKEVVLYNKIASEEKCHSENYEKKLCELKKEIILNILSYHRMLEYNLKINPSHSDEENDFDEETIKKDSFYKLTNLSQIDDD